MQRIWTRWKIRLGAVRAVLSSEFILIHGIKRYADPTAGEPATSYSTLCRTTNSDEHDFLVMKAAAMRKYESLPAAVKAENHG